MGNGWQDGGWGSGWGGGSIFMFVMMIVFWILIAGVIIYALRHFRHEHWYGHGHGPHGGPAPSAWPDGSPVDILRTRFAKGEIDEEEFRRRMSALGNDK